MGVATPPSSRFRTYSALAAVCLIVATILFWRRSPGTLGREPAAPSSTSAVTSQAAAQPARVRAADTATAGNVASSSAEKRAYVARLYRQEQLSRELQFEQLRFAEHYWQTERSPAQMAAIRAQRDAFLRQLSAEANDVLQQLGLSEAGNELTFSPIFDEDHPAPAVAFLSSATRDKLVAALVDADVTNPAVLHDTAHRTLSAGEWEEYTRWNGPGVAATRAALIGFNASEAEFNAVHRIETEMAGEPPAAIDNALRRELGAERFATLTELRDPSTQGAVRDLHRVGGSIDEAFWLAAARQTAAGDIQQVVANPQITAAEKQARIETIHRAFAAAVANKLSLRAANVDELEPSR